MKSSKLIFICFAALLFCSVAARSPSQSAAQTPKSPAAKKPTARIHAAASKTSTVAHRPPHKTVTTPSGLKYADLLVGKGRTPKDGDKVLVDYTGRLTNGKVFDEVMRIVKAGSTEEGNNHR